MTDKMNDNLTLIDDRILRYKIEQIVTYQNVDEPLEATDIQKEVISYLKSIHITDAKVIITKLKIIITLLFIFLFVMNVIPLASPHRAKMISQYSFRALLL